MKKYPVMGRVGNKNNMVCNVFHGVVVLVYVFFVFMCRVVIRVGWCSGDDVVDVSCVCVRVCVYLCCCLCCVVACMCLVMCVGCVDSGGVCLHDV